MKKYLTKERILLIVGLCIFVFGLTSCSGDASSYTIPLNKFGDEKDIFGWLLIWPIGWVMHLIGSIFPSAQFAWGLLFTTIIVRTIAWPIYAKTNDMSLKMAVAQPEMNRIQAKYANRKDPQSQQRMQQEMMAVYKKYKISFLGCFAPFIQMPIFMAMYSVVKRITVPGGLLSLEDASFFGIKNCLNLGIMGTEGAIAETGSAPFIVGIILSALVGISMWLLNYFSQKKPSYQKNTHTHNANPQADQMASTMKFMNYFMIFMMVMAALSNNGLALYWVFGNIYSIIQGFINRYLNEKKYYKMKQSDSVDNLI
jgi:YidC/Oxa1 family membrane protein insertase